MTDTAHYPDASAALKFREAGAAGRDRPVSPILQRLMAYWQSKCHADGRLPARRDIDPVELSTLLPYVYLIDVLPDGKFRIRLLGEEHVAIYGHGLIGKVIDDIFPPASATEFNRLYTAVVRRRHPVINRGQISWLRNKEWMRYEGMHAPLADDGQRIDTIFGAGAFDGTEPSDVQSGSTRA